MVVDELVNLGLSAKEAEVYLATLQLGYASVQKIAEKAEINRTTAYTHIRNLINRGLIVASDRNGKAYFVAERPDKLKFFYHQQEQEIKRRRENLEKIMPELESLYNVDSDRPSVRFYGQDNLHSLRDEIVNSRADELLSIFNYEKFKHTLNKDFIADILDRTLSYKKIYISDNKVLDRKLHDFVGHKRFYIKHLPISKFNCLCELIVGDRQVFIARDNDSLIIQDMLFSQTLSILFGVLWELAEDF